MEIDYDVLEEEIRSCLDGAIDDYTLDDIIGQLADKFAGKKLDAKKVKREALKLAAEE